MDPAAVAPPPASRGRNPVSAHLEQPTTSDEEVGGWPEESPVRVAPEPGPSAIGTDETGDGPADAASAAGSVGAEPTGVGVGAADAGPDAAERTDGPDDVRGTGEADGTAGTPGSGDVNGAEGGDGGRATASRRPAASRTGRPSVPSWDDIVFGTRGGGAG